MALRTCTAALFIFLFIGSFKAFAQTEEDVYYPEKITAADSMENVQRQASSSVPPPQNTVRANAIAPAAARNFNGLSAVLGYAGGFMLGYSLTSFLIQEQEPNWYLIGGGIGLSFIGLQLRAASNKRESSKAGDIRRAPQAQNFDPAMHIGYKGQGLALRIVF